MTRWLFNRDFIVNKFRKTYSGVICSKNIFPLVEVYLLSSTYHINYFHTNNIPIHFFNAIKFYYFWLDKNISRNMEIYVL